MSRSVLDVKRYDGEHVTAILYRKRICDAGHCIMLGCRLTICFYPRQNIDDISPLDLLREIIYLTARALYDLCEERGVRFTCVRLIGLREIVKLFTGTLSTVHGDINEDVINDRLRREFGGKIFFKVYRERRYICYSASRCLEG